MNICLIGAGRIGIVHAMFFVSDTKTRSSPTMHYLK